MISSPDALNRSSIFGDEILPKAMDLLAEGRAAADEWRVVPAAFQAEYHVASELEYKQKAMREGRLMQHAHLGCRSLETTVAEQV